MTQTDSTQELRGASNAQLCLNDGIELNKFTHQKSPAVLVPTWKDQDGLNRFNSTWMSPRMILPDDRHCFYSRRCPLMKLYCKWYHQRNGKWIASDIKYSLYFFVSYQKINLLTGHKTFVKLPSECFWPPDVSLEHPSNLHQEKVEWLGTQLDLNEDTKL